MDKQVECIIVDTNKEEYDVILSSDIFTSEDLIKKGIKEVLNKTDEIYLSRIDAIVKITLKEKEEKTNG